MTRQHLSGELSVLLGQLQAAATTDVSGRDIWSLRHAAETAPVSSLGWVTLRALGLADQLCWDSLNRGDMAGFSRQASVSAALYDFGVLAGLLRES